jgi:hypothetical protein
MVMNVEEEDE